MSKSRTEIKGLCFDKDGTLFDFSATWESWAADFLRRASKGDLLRAAQAGHAVGFDFETRSFSKDSIVIAGTVSEIVAVLAPHFPEYSPDELLELVNEEAGIAPQEPVVPLVPLMSSFRAAGIALGVATNDSETPARAHLDSVGVTQLFDFIAGYDSGYGGKPETGQLVAFANAVGLPSHQIAMVGDSRHDLVAGRAAGMWTVAVLTGVADAEELAPFADVVLKNIGEIPEWLNSISCS
ncbi:MAG: HAD family hydrolase [Sulfitobacter sp.]